MKEEYSRHYSRSARDEYEELDLGKYFRILYRNKGKIIFAGIACGVIVSALLMLIEPRYLATATLSFEGQKANLVDIDEVYDAENGNREYLETQVELIASRSAIDQVARRLLAMARSESDASAQIPLLEGDLTDSEQGAGRDVPGEPKGESVADKAPDETVAEQREDDGSENTTEAPSDESRLQKMLDNVLTAETTPAQLARRITEGLDVQKVRNTQLIQIQFESHSPEFSALVTNLIAEVYLDLRIEAENEITQRATSWLNEKLENSKSNLERAERELREFSLQENLIDIEGIKTLSAKEISDSTAQLLDARRRRQEVATMRDLIRQNNSRPEALLSLPAIQGHERVHEIMRSEAEVKQRQAELALRYGPKHPKMIAVTNELSAVQSQLDIEVTRLVTGIENEYQAALNSENRVRNEIGSLKQEYQNIADKEAEYAQLQRKVEVNKGLYNTFLTRVKEAEDAGGFESAPARLADPAIAPNTPVEKKITLFTALAIFAGLALASAVIFIYELFYDVVRGPEDVEEGIGERLFGVVPLIARKKSDSVDLRAYFEAENYSFSESVRTIRTSIVLSNLDSPAKVIAVTSSVPSEGKTTISQCLSFSLAQMERVLLIDADLRKPAVGRNFGFNVKRPGLTNLLAGRKKIEECIYRDPKSGLDILPSGPTPPDAQRLLGSVEFANYLKLLSARYDRIIIDTPPIQAVSDAMMIARHVDSLLYVVKSRSTRRRVIDKGLDRFRQMGKSADGIILSQVDLAATAEYSSEYYGYYGDQYGYGAPDQGTFEKEISEDGDADQPVIESPRRNFTSGSMERAVREIA